MTDTLAKPCTAFDGHRRLVSGPLIEVALAVKNAAERGAGQSILTFDDATGRLVDFDLRGSKAELIARLSEAAEAEPETKAARRATVETSAEADSDAEPRGRGRPKLGVVAHEVTLLPRHWEWLGQQRGGASATLRRLVDEARRSGGADEAKRLAREAAYRFMSAMAGDLPGFEEAARALFAGDAERFDQQIADWPADLRDYAKKLSQPADSGSVT
jgi:uncharacterized protein